MTEFVEYITEEGDRWDTVAHKAYGNPWAFERIVRANPRVPIRPVLEAGTRLLIPVVDPPAPPAAVLPPWKRTAQGAGE